MIKTIKTLSLAASAVVITSPAFANITQTQNAGQMARGIVDSMNGILDLVMVLSMLGGAIFGVMGLLKLKAAADNPQQVKFSEGLIRIAVGAAMMAPGGVSEIAQLTATGQGTAKTSQTPKHSTKHFQASKQKNNISDQI